MTPLQKTYDVIVVGAGLSGLRAAVECHRARLSVLVLESNNRVGGRTLSVEPKNGSGKIELGAAWINDTSQSEMYSLACEFGFDLIQQRTTGEVIHQDTDGTIKALPHGELPLSTSGQETVSRIVQALDKDTSSIHPKLPHRSLDAASLDKMTFLDYARNITGTNADIAGELANQLASALVGAQAHECSALYLLDYIQSGTGFVNISSDQKHGGQYLRNRQGNQSFSVRLASFLPPGSLHLNTPVSRISQQGSYCVVESNVQYQSWLARRVIVSVPSPNWSHIEFIPPLPSSSVSISKNTALGYYSKLVLVYSKPWWREADLTGVLSAPHADGPVSFSRDTCSEADSQYSITCFLVGQKGRDWSKRPAAERRRQVLEHIESTLGQVARKKNVEVLDPIEFIEIEWSKDAHAKGGPASVMSPGTLTAEVPGTAVIREPFGRVHFVGTDTSEVWKGYMEGAVRSGVRGAQEVIKILDVKF